jgi:long-chain acyl-CoA synthetase
MATCEAAIPLRETDVMGVPGPLSHSLFLFGAVHGLSRGLSVAITEAFQPRAVLRHFAGCGVTVLYLVPAMLRALLDAGPVRWQPRLVFCGGARLDETLRATAEAAWPQADIVAFYGSSELSFVSWASTANPAPPESAGRPFPGVDLRIGDDSGGGGLIEVRSAMVFSRYLDGPPVMQGAWLTAGDTGRLGDDGHLYVTGRQSRIINAAGVKIPAEPIEQTLASWEGIAAAAVIGLPDALRGEVVCAVIVPGAGFDSASLLGQFRAKLPPRHRPRRLFVTGELPRTRSGKVAVAELKAMAEAGDLRLREIG